MLQLVLVIGAKLQHVVTTLAIENASVPGAYVGQLMQPRDQLFWFGRPELLLSVLHLVMFQVRPFSPELRYFLSNFFLGSN